MKYLLLIILFYSTILKADLSDGKPKYTVQVYSNKEVKEVNRKIGEFRKYGYAFALETLIKCSEKRCPSEYSTTNRIYLNIFDSKEDAQVFLKQIKKSNPKLFNDAIIQILVE